MYQYLTADLHFNHKNMIDFSDRPFKNTTCMNKILLNNINGMCKAEDILYHLGDFMFKKSTQAEVVNKKPEKLINSKVIHIKGNHDLKNDSKGMLDFAIITYAKTKYLLCHIPPTSKDAGSMIKRLAAQVDCILCGHVHKAWKTNFYEHFIDDYLTSTIPVINVGTDVWNYRPVRLDKVHNLYLKMIK